MKLANKLTTKEIEGYIKKYIEKQKDEEREMIEELSPLVERNKCIENTEQLFKIGYWKTHRKSKIIKENSDNLVKKITNFAINEIDDEKIKIKILTSLTGVGIPRASAILTFYDPKSYGVIDVNAWKALTGNNKNNFNADDWDWYLKELRKLAKKHDKTPREIDMALWVCGKPKHTRN